MLGGTGQVVNLKQCKSAAIAACQRAKACAAELAALFESALQASPGALARQRAGDARCESLAADAKGLAADMEALQQRVAALLRRCGRTAKVDA